jgi:hypothetical protein
MVFWAAAALVTAAFVVGLILFYTQDSGEFVGSIADYSAQNPASLQTTVLVQNIGTESGTWRCTIKASDPSGSYRGIDILESTAPLGAGESQLYVANLTITNEGASYVTEVTATDCKSS